jgi:hypothetical protein
MKVLNTIGKTIIKLLCQMARTVQYMKVYIMHVYLSGLYIKKNILFPDLLNEINFFSSGFCHSAVYSSAQNRERKKIKMKTTDVYS